MPKIKVVTVRMSHEEHEALKIFAFHLGVSINEVMMRGMRTLLAKEGRTDEFDALLRKSRSTYRGTLDKMKNS